MENNKTVGIIIGIVALVLVGGGVFWVLNNSDDEATTNDTTSQSESTENSSEAEQSSDIVALASGTESLSTLVTAVQAADLVETLQGDGPFTVFAPTNAAFDALPEGTLSSLLEPANKDQLSGILLYHVVPGKVMSTDLSDGQVVTTVQGTELTVDIRDGMVYLVDATGAESMVQTADVEASNGVVHIIDGVLLPQ